MQICIWVVWHRGEGDESASEERATASGGRMGGERVERVRAESRGRRWLSGGLRYAAAQRDSCRDGVRRGDGVL